MRQWRSAERAHEQRRRHCGEEIVDRSGLHYATAACALASGLLAGGPGVALALADPGGVSQHDGDGPGRSIGSGGTTGGTTPGRTGNSAKGASASQRSDTRPQRRPGQRPASDGLATSQQTGDGQQTGGGKNLGAGKDACDPCDHNGEGGRGGGGDGLGAPPPGSSSGGRHHQRTGPPVNVPSPPLQPQPGPAEPNVVDATAGPTEVPGLGAEVPVLTAPLVVPPPLPLIGAGAAAGARAGPAGAEPGTPPAGAPPARGPVPSREPFAINFRDTLSPPASIRVGYNEFLRTAGVTQMAALAGPGVTGILLLTASGGFIGYRQAKAGHTVRTEGIARFLH